MEIKLLKDKINYGGFDALFAELYTENAAARVRYSDSCDRFLEIFGEKDVELFSAPGRTEVGGNHTDHQRGCVLAGSVDMDVIAVVAKNDNNIIRLKSHGYPMDTVDVTDLSVSQDEKGTSASLIRGMAAIFAENGYKIGGFDA
ncbi:MAG: galactokinase family protein, partial [Clostridia bacterium]|nr:galactokinase family protein [Clostridia bacterium]